MSLPRRRFQSLWEHLVRFNYELILVMQHPALAQALERVLIQDLASSDPVPDAKSPSSLLGRGFQRLAYRF